MPKTIKVRVPVAVDPEGRWNASGWEGCTIEDAFDHLDYSVLGPGERIYWLVAEIPIPEPRNSEEEITPSIEPSSETLSE